MSITADITTEATIEGVKAVPPVTVTGALLFGIPLEQWITWMTAIYLLLAIGLQLPKVYKLIKSWFEKSDDEPQA